MLKFAELCVNLHPKLDKTMSMKQIRTLCTLLATILIMASCAGSNNETILYSDAVITSFSLGNLNKYTVTENSDGTTTTTKTTFSASSYKFIIDQVKREIYNNDSLPIGTDVAHVLCSISTVNNGIALFEDLEEPDTYFYYVSSDSIDFTSPRTVRVMSSDANGYTDYTIKVNVHKEDGDKFVWHQQESSDVVKAMNGLKSLYHNDNIYLFGDLYGKTQIFRIKDGTQWEIIAQSTDFSSDAWKNVAATMDTFFLFDGGVIFKSTDADTWTQVNYQSEQPIKQLIGADSYELYALSTENQIMVSADGGATWKAENNDKPTLLPSEDIAMTNYPVYLADNCEQVVMIGNRAEETGDNYAAVWRKIVDFDNVALGSIWTYMDRGSQEDYILPKRTNYNLLCYDDGLLAFGKASNEGGKPYVEIFQSRDNGITWKERKNIYAFPENLDNTAKTTISSVVDDEGNIWLFCAGTGEVWKGRLNRVAWIYN